MSRALGIDLSHHDGQYKPETALIRPDFAFFKLTEGITWIDPLINEIWEGVKQIDIRGGYHYQRSGYSWLVQAEIFLRQAGRFDLQMYALDVEELNNTYNDTFFSDMRRILDYWKTRSEKHVLLYCNYSTYHDWIYPAIKRLYGGEGLLWLADQDVWLSNLNGQGADGEPNLPAQLAAWTIWQYAWNGLPKDYGTLGFVDLNVYNGTKTEMLAWLGMQEADQIPDRASEPTGGSMLYGTVITTTTLNIRSGPGTAYPDIGDLHYGDKLEASESVGGWWKIVKINGTAVASTETFAYANGGLFIRTDAAPVVEPTVTLKHTIKIFSDGSYQVDNGAVVA
jgi:GH25 family lysozyme M1 (1,4-beta-N-acetylmuramidase)